MLIRVQKLCQYLHKGKFNVFKIMHMYLSLKNNKMWSEGSSIFGCQI